MKMLLPLLIAFVVVGCDPAPNATTTTEPPKPTQPSPQPSQPVTAPKTTKSNDNVKRIYQLKSLEQVTLKAGSKSFPAWVMDTDGKREEGMMFLTDKEVKDNEGMIFVFATPAKQSFWMENTILPLDIAFIDKSGVVLNIQKGKPFDESPLPSKGDSLYVLELKQGKAKGLGVVPGAKLTIPQSIKSKD